MEPHDYDILSIRELRQFLESNRVDTRNFIEREEFVKAAIQLKQTNPNASDPFDFANEHKLRDFVLRNGFAVEFYEGKPNIALRAKQVRDARKGSGVQKITVDQLREVDRILLAARDHEMFGIPRDQPLTLDEVKRSFRLKILKVHPDKNPAQGANQAFSRLKEAFDRLQTKLSAAQISPSSRQRTPQPQSRSGPPGSESWFNQRAAENERRHQQAQAKETERQQRAEEARRHKEQETAEKLRKQQEARDRKAREVAEAQRVKEEQSRREEDQRKEREREARQRKAEQEAQQRRRNEQSRREEEQRKEREREARQRKAEQAESEVNERRRKEIEKEAMFKLFGSAKLSPLSFQQDSPKSDRKNSVADPSLRGSAKEAASVGADEPAFVFGRSSAGNVHVNSASSGVAATPFKFGSSANTSSPQLAHPPNISEFSEIPSKSSAKVGSHNGPFIFGAHPVPNPSVPFGSGNVAAPNSTFETDATRPFVFSVPPPKIPGPPNIGIPPLEFGKPPLNKPSSVPQFGKQQTSTNSPPFIFGASSKTSSPPTPVTPAFVFGQQPTAASGSQNASSSSSSSPFVFGSAPPASSNTQSSSASKNAPSFVFGSERPSPAVTQPTFVFGSGASGSRPTSEPFRFGGGNMGHQSFVFEQKTDSMYRDRVSSSTSTSSEESL